MDKRIRIDRPSFFTLVELLVVIAIIVILAGLLFPALSKARETTYMSKCASNLRQVGVAFTCYANDYNEYTPTLWVSSSDDWVVGVRRYFNKEKMPQCDTALRQAGIKYSETTYAMNGYAGNTSTRLKKLTSPQYPRQACVVGDGHFYTTYWARGIWPTTTTPDCVHNGKAVFVFFDGHTEACKAVEIPVDIYVPFWRGGYY